MCILDKQRQVGTQVLNIIHKGSTNTEREEEKKTLTGCEGPRDILGRCQLEI